MAKKFIDLLMIEDDPGDVDIVRGLLKPKKNITLNHVDDGTSALKYLRKEDPYGAVMRPDIILLDLNLPNIDGRQVLNIIKGDSNLRSIPVIVHSTSDADRDVSECYRLGANSYVTKPMLHSEFSKLIKAIDDFWLTMVKLPS